MSNVRYQGKTITITLEGLEDVSRALGDLSSKTPAVVKVALNATAREVRKLMIARAKARYAVNAKGREHLKELSQHGGKGRVATNRDLMAVLYIKKMRNDLGYFKTNPAVPTHFTGGAWRHGPSVWTGKVLKSKGMEPLTGDGNKSKAFLAEFKSGHVGMVQRVIGSESDHTTTKSGASRWQNRSKHVETLETMGSPSAAAMHRKIWPEVEPEAEVFLLNRLDLQIQKVIAHAERRGRS